jgi:cysteine-rich repeat protein
MHRLAIALFLLAACGDNHAVTPDATPDAPDEPTDPCPAVELGTARLQFNWFSQVTGVRYPIKSGELVGSFLVVELYAASTGDLPPLATGMFDLASAPNTNLATCQHCAYIAKERADGSYEVQYFQAEGQIKLTSVTDPLEPVFAGVIGEVCDDGNQTGSDTCSADCQTIDYVASCAAARPIAANTTLAGNTSDALDGFFSSCQGGRARTELYEFSIPTTLARTR